MDRAAMGSSRAALARCGGRIVPEWPDLHVVRDRLEKALVGHEITLVRVGDPLVLRSARPVETALAHRRFAGVRHRGKFLIFDLDKGAIVVNPMLAGVFELADAESKLTRTTGRSLARGVLQVEEHLPPELGTKIRDHMKVRGHKGKPCPRCGTPIVKTRHGLDDMYLCPRCQPPPKGQIR